MAKKIAVGVNGSVTFISGHKAKFDRYELQIGQRLIPTSGYDGGGYEENTAGLKFGRFAASGHPYYDDTDTSPGFGGMTQAGGTSTFGIAPGCTIAATGVLSDISVSSDVQGETRLTFNGATSGVITELWDETGA